VGCQRTVDGMSDHRVHVIERRCDVAVVGGSAAGLAAALQIARQRRSVLVVDAGEPRNAPAAHLHGYLGRDGLAPADLTAAGREEVRSYGGEVLDGRVAEVTRRADGGFDVELVGGHGIVARRVLAATGLVDVLPAIDGVAEQWGRGVIHCPFCHGYEVRDRRVVVIVAHPLGLHAAVLLRHLTDRLVVVLHGGVDAAAAEPLRAGGVDVVVADVRRVGSDDAGAVAEVELLDGRRLAADAVVVAPGFRPRAEPLVALGVRTVPHPSGFGDVVDVGPTGETSVPGVFAAGNVTDPSQQLLQAAADGSRVGALLCAGLAEEDLHRAARPSANAADWDGRYAGGRMWSGNPNGSLVAEVGALPPGRALDVGAGEGGDALWLAEQGWRVTASDVSRRALDHVGEEAARRGLDVALLPADANALDPFPRAAFDLVTAHYASIPRTPDGRGARNLLAAVAPSGTLLVVGHDPVPMRAPIDTATASRAFDPDAYLRVDDVAAVLEGAHGWDVERWERRPRPAGAASAGHHVDDVVLRARRRAS
jgi:thioredoxin reductase